VKESFLSYRMRYLLKNLNGINENCCGDASIKLYHYPISTRAHPPGAETSQLILTALSARIGYLTRSASSSSTRTAATPGVRLRKHQRKKD
jgi:hypothetical protein